LIKTGLSRKSLLEHQFLPFHILQEENLYILVHKNRPSWVVTNEVGKDIAVQNSLKSSHSEIAEFLKNRYRLSESVEEDIKGFINNLEEVGFLKEESSGISYDTKDNFKGLLFLVTQACNLSCYHCLLERNFSVSNDFSGELFYRVVEEIDSLGAEFLLISGGEPLLRPDLFDLISYASQSLKVTLSTNGTLVGFQEAGELKKVGITEIAVSLDGILSQTHDNLRGKGSYERTLNGIDFLKREGLEERIHLNFCLSKLNIDEAIDFPEFAENLGIRRVTFLPVKKLGKASNIKEELFPDRDKYTEFLFKLYEIFFTQGFSIEVNSPLSGFQPIIRGKEQVSTCPFGTQLIVNAAGDIYPCPAMFFPEYHLGSVFEIGIEKALDSEKFRDLQEKHRARRERIAKCKSCTWRNFCQAGCTSSAYLEKGTIWETDDFCEIRDRLYRRAIISASKKKSSRRQEVHVCPL
jgi:radical SAM protein with 4Fe4S-binding SPASM domain